MRIPVRNNNVDDALNTMARRASQAGLPQRWRTSRFVQPGRKRFLAAQMAPRLRWMSYIRMVTSQMLRTKRGGGI